MATAPKPPKGHFNVLYFASAGSFTSKEHESFPAPLELGRLFDVLEERHSGIKDTILSSCLVTVNLEYVDMPPEGDSSSSTTPFMIKEGDEVAIIPPVSSG
ncbi:molybdopterin synthase sulfur carrier subunit [Microdochium bolleyi]|uniref:Molybdopterin synthase sulfur carrier subunit n=1 Tax=Microdochium bolleyi TaxID=196109 RepID=A0A136JFS8_9PEZI|nr:molybdopterin synthase sulfur carrier subunit [Microdochium bolleyi]